MKLLRLPACVATEPVSEGSSRLTIPPLAAETRPILALSHQEQSLYVELIQPADPGLMPSKYRLEMLWVRPLLMVSGHGQLAEVIDLQQTADVLWPKADFSPAYAEDLFPLLAAAVPHPQDRQRLNQFLQQLWAKNRATLSQDRQ